MSARLVADKYARRLVVWETLEDDPVVSDEERDALASWASVEPADGP